jgi:hypothetical protein
MRRLCLALLIGLVGCAGRDPARFTSVYYSLTGEPLSGGPLGRPDCAVALTAWLGRIDRNADGGVDRDELAAAARRQFAVMDLNQDGTVTPAELETYRSPYGPPPRGRGDRPRPSGLRAEIPSNRPDPVMAADTALRFRVDLAEFLAHVDRQFDLLDRNGDGRIEPAEITRSCSE